MTLPASGPISMSQVNTELGRASTALLSMNDSAVRNLAGVPSGAIGFNSLQGKSSLSAVGSDDSRAYSSATSGGTASAFPSVVASGGIAPISYLWSFTSNPNSASLTFSTSAQCTVSKNFAKNAVGNFSAVLQCVVTDNAGASVTVTNIHADAGWEP